MPLCSISMNRSSIRAFASGAWRPRVSRIRPQRRSVCSPLYFIASQRPLIKSCPAPPVAMSATALIFVAGYALGLLRTFAGHAKWGVFTYIAVFYLQPQMRWWGASLPSSIRWSLLAAILVLFALPRVPRHPGFAPWASMPIVKVMLWYVVWMWVQLAWANPMHFNDVVLMSKYALLFFLFYRILNSEESLIQFSLVHILGCFYFSWLAYNADGAGRLENIGGPGTNDSNTLGMHVSTSFFFIATLLLTQKKWLRWLPLLTLPFIANTLVQTESRGAFLGAACGSVTYYYMAPKRCRLLMVPLAVLSLCALLAYAPSTYWNRIASIGAVTDEEEIDGSAESRIFIIKAQIEMFKAHPFGLGSRTTAYLSRAYLDTKWLTAEAGKDRATQGSRASHNTLMAVVTDQGIPGLLLAIVGGFCMLGMFRQMRRVSRTCHNETIVLLGASACASLTVVYIAGLFTNYLRAEIQIWAMGVLGVVLQLARLSAQSARLTERPPEEGKFLPPTMGTAARQARIPASRR